MKNKFRILHYSSIGYVRDVLVSDVQTAAVFLLLDESLFLIDVALPKE